MKSRIPGKTDPAKSATRWLLSAIKPDFLTAETQRSRRTAYHQRIGVIGRDQKNPAFSPSCRPQALEEHGLASACSVPSWCN